MNISGKAKKTLLLLIFIIASVPIILYKFTIGKIIKNVISNSKEKISDANLINEADADVSACSGSSDCSSDCSDDCGHSGAY